MSKMMHLGSMSHGIGGHVSGWRMPGAYRSNDDVATIARDVQLAEEGKFDLAFFADAVNTGADAKPGFLARLEPLTLLSALSQLTSRIGLVATVSTTYSEPYNVARQFASLDRMSNGRAGWNVVTGSSPDAAPNFSREKHPDHAERYEMAEEYLQVTRGLWDSFDDDAIAADPETGVYLDPAKLHTLDHHGKYFDVRGPLNARRPPQGYPVIFQAGASDRGLEFAGSSAEVVFASQSFLDEAQIFRRRLQDATEAAGRPRDAVRLLLGVNPIVADSREEAMAIVEELSTYADPLAAMRVLEDRVGISLSGYDLDGPLPELPPSTMMQGHARVLESVARRNNMTIRELRNFAAVSTGHRVVMGSPEEIAEDLASWFLADACDGFAIMSAYGPGPFRAFVERVVPLLQERGLFRKEYEGTTLRDHLGLERPASQYAVAG